MCREMIYVRKYKTTSDLSSTMPSTTSHHQEVDLADIIIWVLHCVSLVENNTSRFVGGKASRDLQKQSQSGFEEYSWSSITTYDVLYLFVADSGLDWRSCEESIITQWCEAGPWICVARSLKWLLARRWQPSNPREKTNSVVDAASSLLSSSRRSRTVRDQEVYCLRSTKPHLSVIRIFFDIYFLVSDTQPRPFASQLDMTGLRYRNQLTWTWERPRVRHYKWKSCGSGEDVWYRVVSEFKSTYVWRFAISRTLDEEIRIVLLD